VWASLRYIPGMGGHGCMRWCGWWIIHSRRCFLRGPGCSLGLFWVCVIPWVCCVLGDVPVVLLFYFRRGTASSVPRNFFRGGVQQIQLRT
jgi:hypothetical protein